MLVLTRKENESVVIDGDIEVVVVRIGGDRVRLGFRAAKDVAIHRREVFELIQRNGRKVNADETAEDKTR